MEKAIVNFLKSELREVDQLELQHSVEQKTYDRELQKSSRNHLEKSFLF